MLLSILGTACSIELIKVKMEAPVLDMNLFIQIYDCKF